MIITDTYVYASPGYYLEVLGEGYTQRVLKAPQSEQLVLVESPLGTPSIVVTRGVITVRYESGLDLKATSKEAPSLIRSRWFSELITSTDIAHTLVSDNQNLLEDFKEYYQYYGEIAKEVIQETLELWPDELV